MNQAVVVLLSISLIAFVISMVSGANNSKKLKHLKEKEKAIKKQLLEVSIRQVVALNNLLLSGVITQDAFYIKLNKVYCQCIDHGIDITILRDIKPDNIISKNGLKKRLMNTAVVLNESGELTIDELNEIIDEMLDDCK